MGVRIDTREEFKHFGERYRDAFFSIKHTIGELAESLRVYLAVFFQQAHRLQYGCVAQLRGELFAARPKRAV
jgi:hypothetical protein